MKLKIFALFILGLFDLSAFHYLALGIDMPSTPVAFLSALAFFVLLIGNYWFIKQLLRHNVPTEKH